MSLNKAILHNKTKRKPYRGGKLIDPHCRNHGSCSYCRNSRTFFDKRKRIVADKELKEEY